MIDLPIRAVDIFNLLRRFATLTIWDAFNVTDEPAPVKPIWQNEHYIVYDRGSCLVVAPKKLFSHDRNLTHAFEAVVVAMQEAQKRGWVTELSGFPALIEFAAVEARKLNTKVLRYTPREELLQIIQQVNALVENRPVR